MQDWFVNMLELGDGVTISGKIQRASRVHDVVNLYEHDNLEAQSKR